MARSSDFEFSQHGAGFEYNQHSYSARRAMSSRLHSDDTLNTVNVGSLVNFSLLKVVGLLFLFFLVGRTLIAVSSGVPVSIPKFQELLYYFRDAPSIPLDWVYAMKTDLMTSFPDWLAWLGAIIDTLVKICQVGTFTGVACLNLFTFLFYILTFLFTF